MSDHTTLSKTNPFSGWPMIIFWAGMFVFAGHACTHMVAAGDTWVAMACGRHYVNHNVDTIEPFSANSHHAGPTDEQLERFPEWSRPMVKKIHPTGWVNQNWGTHAIFYWLADTFRTGDDYNYNMLIYWKFTVTILSAVAVFYSARVLGVAVPLAAVAASFAMFIGRTFIDVRPAVFSNMIIAVYFLILTLTSCRNIKFIWLIVPLAIFWCNVHGGYIYIFITLVPLVGLNLITCKSQTRFATIGLKGIYHTIAAGFAALLATIIFNPYHLTNITHTFEVSVSEHAKSWRSVNEWHGAFEWENPVGQETAFLVMFIILWVALALWFVARILRPRIQTRRRARQETDYGPYTYQWPKIDLALLAIAAFTVYMAVKSRRFIPVGAVVACPVIAMLIHQAICMFIARYQFNRNQKQILPPMTKTFKHAVILIATHIVLFAGTAWGIKFKKIYLDPWPNDAQRDSVFMRMTASSVKPFDACYFLRENKLSGKMFNYWTEGGAIAFGQAPDPETGQIPLKLFMDGRAQAAYDHDKFILWRDTISGQLAANDAQENAKKFDTKYFGNWLTKTMKGYDVWVILMPSSQLNSLFMKALQTQINWRTAYLDNYQVIMVDYSTEKGKTLINKMLKEQAEFPSEFTKYLTIGRNLMQLNDPAANQKGFEYVIKAFETSPSGLAMSELMRAGVMPHLKRFHKQVSTYSQTYLEKFLDEKDALAIQGGYLHNLSAATEAARHLSNIYKKTNPEKTIQYKDLYDSLRQEQKQILLDTKW